MSRNNTGNPIGSKAFPDFEDNVKNLDEAVNTADPQWVDRFGRFRLPLMEQERQFVSDQERREGEFQADQSSREAVFSDFLQASGYQDLGEYAPGIEITAHNQYVTFGGQPYTLKPSIPVPYTASGEWTGADFKLIGDDSLRQDLANPSMGAAMVARGVVAVDSIADLQALPEEQRRAELRYTVKGYYPGGATGGGEFYWTGGDMAAEVLADPLAGVFIPPLGESGASGAFVRVRRGQLALTDFGVSGEVAPQDFEATLALVRSLNLPFGSAVDSAGPIRWTEGLRFINGNFSTLNQTAESAAFIGAFANSNNRPSIFIERATLTQPYDPDPGAGTSNDIPVVASYGGENSTIVFNKVDSASVAVSIRLANNAGPVDRRDLFPLVAFNYLKDVQKMSIESIGAFRSRIIGNAMDSEGANSHFIRITGYDGTHTAGELITPAEGVVVCGNTGRGGKGEIEGAKYASSISIQNAARFFSLAANSFSGAEFGLQVTQGTSAMNHPRHGQVSGVFSDNFIGVDNYGSKSTTYDLVVYNSQNRGIRTRLITGRPAEGGNTYRGIVATGPDSAGSPLELRHSDDTVDVTVDYRENPSASACQIIGDRLRGRLHLVGATSNKLLLGGSGHHLTITNEMANDTEPATVAMVVSGGASKLDIVSKGRVNIDGSGGNLISLRGARLHITSDNNTVLGSADFVSISGNNNKLIGSFSAVNDTGAGNSVI